MVNIWFTSDTHFGHDKPFIYEPRGFSNINEMDEAIIERWNSVIKPGDLVYHLGDVLLGDLDKGIENVLKLNGKINLAIGNHDTERRLMSFYSMSKFNDVQMGYRIKVSKTKTFLLTHYPTLTENHDKTMKVYSIHGHTHDPRYMRPEYPLMYNVNCDAHFCTPVHIDEIISDLDKIK